MSGQSSDIRKWDNDVYKWDVSEASKEMNPWLKNFGRDRLTYQAEMTHSTAVHAALHEGPQSHGYPYTSWLQLSLVYAAGLYTAKEQGIVKKGVFFHRYWRAHYFDWIMFLRRAGIYGIAGGFILGTYAFGDTRTAINRAINRYHFLFSMEKPDPKQRNAQYLIKF